MRRKTKVILFTSFLLLIFCGAVFSQTRSKRPVNIQSKVRMVISGKSRTYYPLPFEKPATINLKGPAKLKIVTRARFKPGEKNNLDYSIKYQVDGGKIEETGFTGVERSRYAVYRKGIYGIPGDKEEIIIEVGLGYHTINVFRGEKDINIAARFRYSKMKAKKRSWISLTPDHPNEPVDLVTREEMSHYYRFSEQKPLRFDIIGPTQVRVLTRPEIDYKMKGRIIYRVQVKDGKNLLNNYMLSTVKSEVTGYLKNGKLIPGKAREIVINVPSGRHRYEICPLDKDKHTLLAKLLFPKSDVKLEE